MQAVNPAAGTSWRRAILFGLAGISLVLLGWRWFIGEPTWPPELDTSPTAGLFSNHERPTETDLELLGVLVSEIAQRDPVVIDLLAGRPWPEPEISPITWIGGDGCSAIIGASFNVDLDGADYFGPWPAAGCDGTRYRGIVLDARAENVGLVGVSIDLNFERVTHLSMPPQPVGTPTASSLQEDPSRLTFVGEFPDQPWYTGRCRRSLGPN